MIEPWELAGLLEAAQQQLVLKKAIILMGPYGDTFFTEEERDSVFAYLHGHGVCCRRFNSRGEDDSYSIALGRDSLAVSGIIHEIIQRAQDTMPAGTVQIEVMADYDA